jgi:hypothetical protein
VPQLLGIAIVTPLDVISIELIAQRLSRRPYLETEALCLKSS